MAFSGAPDTAAKPQEVARMRLIVNSYLSAKILLVILRGEAPAPAPSQLLVSPVHVSPHIKLTCVRHCRLLSRWHLRGTFELKWHVPDSLLAILMPVMRLLSYPQEVLNPDWKIWRAYQRSHSAHTCFANDCPCVAAGTIRVYFWNPTKSSCQPTTEGPLRSVSGSNHCSLSISVLVAKPGGNCCSRTTVMS